MKPSRRRLLVALAAPVLVGVACQGFALGSGSGAGAASASSSSNAGAALLGAAQAISCPELVGGGSALGVRYTADARVNAKVGAFVQAAKDLSQVAASVEAEVAGACTRMGADLGLRSEQMAAQAGAGGRAKGACAALAAEIEGILAGGVRVEASYEPPRCEVNASAKASCEGTCRVEATPAEIVAQCEPARLSGRCEGTCGGRCEGTCNGTCSGACSAKDAQGRCIGRCDGECRGGCSGTCHARCEGNWQAPKCEGKVTPPTVDAECRASCDARAELTGQCTKPRLELKASSSTERIGKLLATATVHVPALLVAQVKLGARAAKEVQVLVKLGHELSGKLQGAGSRAVACVSAAASAVAEASVQINVSVQASASVSGKVGAST